MSGYELKKRFYVNKIFTCFQHERETNFYFGGEAHNFWEAVFVMDGELGITEDDRVYELSKGNIIFHKPMEFHKVWSRGSKKPVMMVISFNLIGDAPKMLENGVKSLSPPRINELLEIFNLGSNVINEHVSDTDSQILSSKLELFLLEMSKEEEVYDKTLKSDDALRYKRIIRIMNEHIRENLSVADIAKYSGLSESNLKVVFAKFSDGGVKKRFNRMKILFSINLLKQNMSVSEISEYLSFSSQNYYSLVFKNETGLSPIVYKNKYLSP